MEDTHPFLRDGSATTDTERRCRTLDGLRRTSCYLTELPWKIGSNTSREVGTEKHWIPNLNEDCPQQPLNQRHDFAQAKRECKILQDEYMARTHQEYRTIPRSQQVRQRKEQQFEQAGSINQSGETCRLRRRRPRPRIGTAIFGRQEVGIPSILQGLTIREKILRQDQFRLAGR